MAKLSKKSATWIGIGATVFLSAAIAALFFIAPIRRLGIDIEKLSKLVQEERVLMSRKPALEAQWQKKIGAPDQGLDAEAVLSAWVKNLLSMAQSQSLALEKLEPAGVKSGPSGKTVSVFISFQGDVRRLVSFIYRLAQEDSLSRVEFFSVRQEEGSKNFFFELTLAKVVR